MGGGGAGKLDNVEQLGEWAESGWRGRHRGEVGRPEVLQAAEEGNEGSRF